MVDNQIGVGLITGNFIICSYVEGALIQTQYGCNTNDMVGCMYIYNYIVYIQ